MIVISLKTMAPRSIQIVILMASIFISCGQSKYAWDNKTAVNDKPVEEVTAIDNRLNMTKDTIVKFLWREQSQDTALQSNSNSMIINEHFCRIISDPEKAALGYVATFIGNECQWEDSAKDDRSNLKCKILSALNLGYQCSDQHLGFLRQWFRNDKKALTELEDCPATPWTSTIQDTFDEITLTVKGNKIIVVFKANGVDTSSQHRWDWLETDLFEFDKDNIKLISIVKSKAKQTSFKWDNK